MTDQLPRRDFFTRLAATSFAAGFAPSLASPLLASLDVPAGGDRFALPASDDDAAVFAAARKRFLFPTSVTYCNTGTLGAIPKDVMDVVVQGLQQLEHDLPDWPYFQADGEPLTGYQQLAEFRAEAGAFINAPMEAIAFTQNATMGMSFIANGLDLAAGAGPQRVEHLACPIVGDGAVADAADQRGELRCTDRAGLDRAVGGIEPA